MKIYQRRYKQNTLFRCIAGIMKYVCRVGLHRRLFINYACICAYTCMWAVTLWKPHPSCDIQNYIHVHTSSWRPARTLGCLCRYWFVSYNTGLLYITPSLFGRFWKGQQWHCEKHDSWLKGDHACMHACLHI